MASDQSVEQQAPGGELEAEHQEQPKTPVSISLDLFQSVRQAQSQHGLRHNDYKRYRHLTLPLINAERAWSLGKELEAQKQEEMSSHRRQHQIRRFSKAAQWAAELARLAGAKGDSRTHLEAEAYAAGLAGLALQSKGKDLATAVAKYQRAETILQHLCEVGSYEQQNACRQQLGETQGSLRFVKYELGRKGQAETGTASQVDDIQAKLDLLDAEQPAVDKSSSTTSLTWRGITYQVRNQRVRANLQQVADLSQQQMDRMQTDQAAHESGQYDPLIGALNETKASLSSLLKAAPGGSDMAGADREDLEQLERAVRGRLLEVQILKLSAQCRAAQGQFENYLDMASSAAKPKEQSSKAESLVRFYDGILNAAESLGRLAGEELRGAQAEHLEEEAAAKVAESKAGRCFYVANAYLISGKQLEAHALFGRAAQHAKQAVKQHKDCMQVDNEAVQRLQLLEQQATAWQGVAHAESVASEQQSQEGIAQATGSLSLQQKGADQHKQHQYMLDHLEQWTSFVAANGKDARFTSIPPVLQQVAIRPFMLDNALNHLAAPSIDHRVAKKEQPKSAFAKLFSWGK